MPAGGDGLLFLPYLMGERTPIWDVNARGVLFGLSLNHTKGHVVRRHEEAVAFALYHSFETLQTAGLRVHYPLVLNEGGARSALWRRIITDVFDVPTVLVERRTGAPLGDAILAGVATGVFRDFGVAARGRSSPSHWSPIRCGTPATWSTSRSSSRSTRTSRTISWPSRGFASAPTAEERQPGPRRADPANHSYRGEYDGTHPRLRARAAAGKPIAVGIVGCGQMGSGLAHAIHNVEGMRVAAIADIDPERALATYSDLGVSRDAIVVAATAAQAEDAIRAARPRGDRRRSC